ncbi:MAG: hypothetical protein AAF702_21645 [Chloroflexota bacterium]
MPVLYSSFWTSAHPPNTLLMAMYGDFGRVTHVQAFVALPPPSADSWQTQFVQSAAAQ